MTRFLSHDSSSPRSLSKKKRTSFPDTTTIRPLHRTRVATLRAYCGAADAGGEVAFPVAGLKVRPPKHAALLIIYKGKDLYMDHGKTRYGGCAASAGADVVATTFVREAVSANEPWASFAAKGIN